MDMKTNNMADLYQENGYLYIIPDAFLEQIRDDPAFGYITVTDIGCFPNAAGHQVRRAKGCKSCIVLYCGSGTGYYEFGGTIRKMTKGQVVLIPPNAPHRYYADNEDPWDHYWIHWQGSLLPVYCERMLEKLPVTLLPTVCTEIEALFHTAFDLLLSNYEESDYFYLNQLAGHILGLIQCTAGSGGVTWRGERTVESAVAYMKRNIRGNITLEELAETTGYSVSYLIQLFRKLRRMPPIEFFQRMKLQAASRDLFFTDASIKEIALSYGFTDPLYFSRRFKQITGLSPKQYRNSRAKG